MAEKTRSYPKTKIGKVVSNKMDKTVVVLIERFIKHPIYKKFVRKNSKIYAHDKANTCQIGDTVKLIESTRPLSKTKRWRLLQVVEKAK